LIGPLLGEQVLLHNSFKAKSGFEAGPLEWDSLVSESRSSCLKNRVAGSTLPLWTILPLCTFFYEFSIYKCKLHSKEHPRGDGG
jgi:hypothetical protein